MELTVNIWFLIINVFAIKLIATHAYIEIYNTNTNNNYSPYKISIINIYVCSYYFNLPSLI